MGLDVYAGTLTRYYSHNWKTTVQQWAEENGYAFQKITPDGQNAADEEELSTARFRRWWRLAGSDLSAISRPEQSPYVSWPEDNERPYYTDKPDWDAFGAMLLVAACHTYGEPVRLLWKRTGTSWNTFPLPALHKIRNEYGRCFGALPGGFLCRTAFCSKVHYPTEIKP